MDKTSDKIDVCLIAPYFYPVYSGAGERFKRYAPGFLDRGIQLRVLTLNQKKVISQEIVNDIQIQRFSIPSDSNLYNDIDSDAIPALLLKKAIQYFRKTNDWPDILHVLSYDWKSLFEIFQARLHYIPCFLSVTMMPFEIQRQKRRIRKYIHQWIRYLPFNYVIVQSETMARLISTQGTSTKRIETIPNGVDIFRFRPPTSPEEKVIIRKSLNLNTDSEIILFLGSIIHRKGIDLLVEAWSEIAFKHPKALLMLIGPNDNNFSLNMSENNAVSYLTQNNRRIKDSTAPERVLITGERQNVELFMRAADLFIFPSRLEGFPNAVVEAMASGLPCILTPFEGLSSELGRPGQEYLLAQSNPKSLAENTINLLNHSELRSKLGIAARKFMEEHMNIDESLDKYAHLYYRSARLNHIK